jgi:hypothetical protein
MSLDGGLSFDDYIVKNLPNTGSFNIAILDTAWLTDYTKWDGVEKEAKIRVEASSDPTLGDESNNVFTIPITLGILNGKNCAASGDMDTDGVKNEVEEFLGMNPESFDSDRDYMYDFNELFHETSFNEYDPLPDEDGDGQYAPNDTDDNGDGVHDGELVDSDKDGVSNYLEYYGFTYNWLTGKFLKWDDEDVQEDFTAPYFKTDPMQPSSDQDPYNDGMEVSGLMMDQSVKKPGNIPMIPAMPNIVIELIGYQVTLNADIADAEGGSETEGTSWTRETSRESTTEDESNWNVSVNAKFSFAKDGGFEIGGSSSYGGKHSTSTTTSTSEATEESQSAEVNWSTTTTTNPTEAAAIKLFLKVRNTGTACASNIIPTFTLMVGHHPVATFEQGNSQINLLAPGGVYPAGDVPWVIDSIDTGVGVSPIYLTLSELKSFEAGAPVSIVMTQMLADVASMDEYGHWQYAGSWSEYIARVDAVCAHLYLDPGDGNVLSYMVYADDDPSAPTVTMRDAFLWSGAYEDEVKQTIYMPYRLANGDWSDEPMDLNGFSYYVDSTTYNAILSVDNAMDVVLTPDAYIVGKAPPVPPLDKPQIYWVCWNPDDHMVNAFVTDYFAVKEVWLVSQSSGTHKMEYDPNLGYYTKELDSLTKGVDYIYAVNIADAQSDNVYIQEMAEPPDLYPDISNPSYEIREEKSDLRAIACAKVTSDQSPITQVLLLDYQDVPIGPMTYDSITAKYYYSEEIDPDFQPPATVKIRASNESGKSTAVSIPESAYIYPYDQYTTIPYSIILGPTVDPDGYVEFMKYWDFDKPEPADTPRELKREFKMILEAVSDFDYDIGARTFGYVLPYWMLDPGLWLTNPTLKWVPISGDYSDVNFFKDDIEVLWEQNKGSATNVGCFPDNFMILMLTGEGRLAYMVFPPRNPWDPVWPTRMGAYSLYDGPHRYIDVTTPLYKTIIFTNPSIDIKWESSHVPGDVKIVIKYYSVPPIEVFNKVIPNNGSYTYKPEVGVFGIGIYRITISDVSNDSCYDCGMFFALPG